MTRSDWSDWIGRGDRVADTLDAWRAAALAGALELEAAAPQFGDPLPATWNWAYFLAAHRHTSLGPDGHLARGQFMPPVPLPSRMWAAGSFEIGEPAPRIGRSAERVSRIESVESKRGRSGPLCFVAVRHAMGGLEERQTIVYRTAREKGAPAAGFEPGEAASRSRDWQADERMLFRYSALTYNAHRIHYDLDWCRTVEGYPGLVVHGPLLASAMFDLAQTAAAEEGRRIRRFEYRAEAPVFHVETFRACGAPREDGMALWIEGGDGSGRMRGGVSWRPPHG